MNIHEYYMRKTIQQANIALQENEVPTGCIIVRQCPDDPHDNGRIIARAHNQVELLKDPTAHAEMIAITQAASAIGDWRLTDTILYVTKEPCPMCAGAIILARIPIVVFGVSDPKAGGAVSLFNILNNTQLNHHCKIISGIFEDECRSMLQNFFKAKRK